VRSAQLGHGMAPDGRRYVVGHVMTVACHRRRPDPERGHVVKPGGQVGSNGHAIRAHAQPIGGPAPHVVKYLPGFGLAVGVAGEFLSVHRQTRAPAARTTMVGHSAKPVRSLAHAGLPFLAAIEASPFAMYDCDVRSGIEAHCRDDPQLQFAIHNDYERHKMQDVINTPNDVIATALDVSRLFGNVLPLWRGHKELHWDLVPRIYRDGFVDGREQNLTLRFRAQSLTLHKVVPPDHDLPGWLYLMQHYGLPTRILDWSRSVLTALFFCVENTDAWDHDGALWALAEARLIESQLGTIGFRSTNHPDIEPLFRAAFDNECNSPGLIIPMTPGQIDARHVAQDSAYTIHGFEKPLNDLPDSTKYLIRLRVPSISKPGLYQFLKMIGVHRAKLFPDLENLARHLTEERFVRGA